MKKIFHIVIVLCAGIFSASAQQESQYSQYMYNTMTFNPGYTGSREVLSVLGLYRTQWVGLEGAPKTMNFSVQSPISERNALGLNVVSDQIGPSKTTTATLNYSYTILGSTDVKYSFGISGGFDNFEVDYNKLNRERPEDLYLSGTISQFSPNVGVGFYVHSYNWYVGLASPRLLKTSYYDDIKETTYSTKSHVYLIGGYVFDLNPYLKFKPAALIKGVSGAPLSVDVSASFLINDKLTLGAAYRWDAAVSALAGFQITDGLQIGYAYDYDTTKIGNYNSGSHEIFLRFELFSKSKTRLVTPRFF
ncbi:PorP/SprF family type IX secretion system membrane protein [Flavobacterium phragmitis]|uniref:Type IX secretion system membrane protein, PorP/SprF family n=1 Tax=Flavobacterium phragmitis TaxID=739143 RepID=A0A1I1T8Z5_9FLAO|nr:type IX secretion system membrane protein PorP/SprF [Flavobacterium phragmitis]SFD53598.1 type IX secretion system membrane protein, PorP/SprF family [Flavobacterium phragmitis]